MKKTFIMAFVLAAVVGLVVAGSAFAQGNTPPAEGKKGDGVLREYITNAMADALGISVEELETMQENKELREFVDAQGFSQEEMKALMQDARTTAIDAALADGVITEEQIEKFKNRDERRGGRNGEGQDAQNGSGALHNYIAPAMADALGITVEELEAAHENGEVRELIEAQGLTQEEMQTAMQGIRERAVDAALADGVLTEEQAEQMKNRSGRGARSGRGGRGGRGKSGQGFAK